jgi:hypothetical protein
MIFLSFPSLVKKYHLPAPIESSPNNCTLCVQRSLVDIRVPPRLWYDDLSISLEELNKCREDSYNFVNAYLYAWQKPYLRRFTLVSVRGVIPDAKKPCSQ